MMPQLSDSPHHCLLNVRLHSSFQQIFWEAFLWIGVIIDTETRTIPETMPFLVGLLPVWCEEAEHKQGNR